MDVFPGWNGYVERLEANWRKLVKPEDTIVLAGDISWDKTRICYTWRRVDYLVTSVAPISDVPHDHYHS